MKLPGRDHRLSVHGHNRMLFGQLADLPAALQLGRDHYPAEIHMPDYIVRVEQTPSIPVAVIQRRARAADLSRLVPQDCGTVWKVLRAQGAPAGRKLAIYWDRTIRLETGVEISGPFAGDGTVVASATPGGVAATTIHFGP